MAGESNDADEDMMAAMGFSAFGMQGQKRKFGAHDDAFIGSSIKSSGETKSEQPAAAITSLEPALEAKVADGGDGGSGGPAVLTRDFAVAEISSKPGTDPSIGREKADGGISQTSGPTLEALRHGVRNENGDTVFFLPSFIDDPWKHLKRG